MNYTERFRVVFGARVKLKDVDAAFKDRHESHKEAIDEIALNAVLDWFTQRKTEDPDGHQHIVTRGGRVIGVEAGDNGRYVMIH